MKKEKKTPIELSSTSAVLLANGYIRKAQQQLDTKVIIPNIIWQIIESFFYSAFNILDTPDKILIGDTNSINSHSNAYLQHQYESYYYIKKYFFDSDSPYKIDGIVYSRIKFLDDSEIEKLNKENKIIKSIPSYPNIGKEGYGTLLNEEIFLEVVKKRHLETLNSPVLFAVCTAKPNNKIKGAFLFFYCSYYENDAFCFSLLHNYNRPWKMIVKAWSENLRLNNLKKDWNDSKYNYKLESHLYVLSISEKEAEDIIGHNKEYYTCDQTNSKSLESRFPFFNISNFFCRKGFDDIEDIRNLTFLDKILKDSELGKQYFLRINYEKEFTPKKLKKYREDKQTIGDRHAINRACPYIYINKIKTRKEDNKNKENKENKENYASFQNQIKKQNLFINTLMEKRNDVKGECYKHIENSYNKYVSICSK